MIILDVVNIQANTIMMQKNKLCKKYNSGLLIELLLIKNKGKS